MHCKLELQIELEICNIDVSSYTTHFPFLSNDCKRNQDD